MNLSESYKKTAQARIHESLAEYRKYDLKREMVNFVIRIGQNKHLWAEEEMSIQMHEIDSEIQAEGYKYYDARGSVARFGRGYSYSRFADIFTQKQDEVTRTAHEYLDPYLRISLMVRNGASDQEILENEHDKSDNVPVSDLISHSRTMLSLDQGYPEPVGSFRTIPLYRDQMKFSMDATVMQARQNVPMKYAKLKGSAKFIILSYVELLMLAIPEQEGALILPEDYTESLPDGHKFAAEFWSHMRYIIKEFRRESEFVKISDAENQLDLMN